MPSYRPSCVINLKLKFDESLHLQQVGTPVSVDTTLEQPPLQASNVQIEPLITRRGDENVSFVLNRIPRSGSIELPGYRQAGKFEFEMRFRDIPIDPRTVRAAAVEVHLGAVSDQGFRDGMIRPAPQDQTRSSIIRTRTDDGLPNPETLVMVGTVDEWNANHTDSVSSVSINGRDMRGILLDTPVGTDPIAQSTIISELDLSLPIDALIVDLLSYNPLFGDFSVASNPAEWPNGEIPAVGDASVVPRHRRGARGRRRGGRSNPNSGGGRLNFWDLCVRFCYLVGAIPYFQGTQLRIRPSRSIFEQARAGGPLNPTPFAGGAPRGRDAQTDTAIDPPLRFRRMVYGRDLLSLGFNRKMAGYQRPGVVRAVSVDNSSGERGQNRVIVGVWPPQQEETARRTRRSPGQRRAQQDIVNVPVPGIRDVDRLTVIARGIYEEIGRGEVGGAASTRSLASFGGTNADPDLLRLKPGDGVEFLVDVRNLRTSDSPLISTLTDHLRTGFDGQVRAIQERIGDENLSRVIVATSRGQIQEIQRFFRVSTVKFGWSDTGVQIDFDFQNYVVPIFNVGDSTDQTQEGAVQESAVPEAAAGA